MRWLRSAAEFGLTTAQFQLAELYRDGRGGARDDEAASINDPVGGSLGAASDLSDASILDPDISAVPGYACSVDDGSTLYVDVVGAHDGPLQLSVLS